MHNDPAVLPRKKPRQRRSQETVAAILDATARILREGGVEAVSTNKVAKVAGVSVGSLYQYFPNKEALVQALAEEHSAGQIAALGTMMQGEMGGPADLVRTYVRSSIHLHKEDPALHLAVTTAMVTRGLGRALQDHEAARQLVLAYMAMHSDQIDVPEPEQASWILVTTVDMLIHTALFEDAGRLDDPRFEQEVVRLVLRYLGIDDDGVGV